MKSKARDLRFLSRVWTPNHPMREDLSVKIELCRKIWPESSSSKSTRETKTVPWASENDFNICQEELERLQQV